MTATMNAQQVRESLESMRRGNALIDRWLNVTGVAIAEGATRVEVRDAARHFARLIEESGPRRGLCRFGR